MKSKEHEELRQLPQINHSTTDLARMDPFRLRNSLNNIEFEFDWNTRHWKIHLFYNFSLGMIRGFLEWRGLLWVPERKRANRTLVM